MKDELYDLKPIENIVIRSPDGQKAEIIKIEDNESRVSRGLHPIKTRCRLIGKSGAKGKYTEIIEGTVIGGTFKDNTYLEIVDCEESDGITQMSFKIEEK